MPTSGRFSKSARRLPSACGVSFASQGFVEVETPILQVSPGNETHLHAPRTELTDRAGNRLDALSADVAGICRQEAACGGGERDYSSSRGCFATGSAATCICRSSRCWSGIARKAPTTRSWPMPARWPRPQPRPPEQGCLRFAAARPIRLPMPERLTVAEAFLRYAGVDLLPTIDGGEGNRDALAKPPHARCTPCGRRHVVRYLLEDSGRARRAETGAGAHDAAVRISRAGVGAGARQRERSRASPSGSSSMHAASSSRTALAN